jgi:hypothetical protein
MPNIDGSSINGLLSTPLVLPASLAGALAALLIVLAVLAVRRAGTGGTQRLLLPIGALVIGVLAVIGVLNRLALDDRAAERRALLQRNAELNRSAVAPGSMLGCLDSGAGETIESACEKAVFADPQTAAAAIAYISARLSLLRDAVEFAQRGDGELIEAFAAGRRAIELDRFGIAAHVLAFRDGCTAQRCAAFALLRDSGVVKANLRVHAFDTYVARYASAWNKSESVAEKKPAAPAPAPVAGAPPPSANQPVASRYDFPSAASIPPVSIMNAEPPLPKDPGAEADVAPGAEAAAPRPKVPVPPKRPQTQAATPPAR